MVNFISREILAPSKPAPHWQFHPDFDIRKVTKPGDANRGVIAEFVGTGDFAEEWVTRREYEVNAGRDQEPILYESFYDVQVNRAFPRVVPVYRLGPGGVVFEEVVEGGEVKFATVGSSDYTITIREWAFGFEYSRNLRLYNELWNVGIIERQAAIAYNALRNHIHISPILNATYAAANKTAASSDGTTLAEKAYNTLKNAVAASLSDTTNPRRGPYDLLIASADIFLVEDALRRRRQDGIDEINSAMSRIQNVIAYDGWTGTRGKKSTTYSGVTSGTAYLISKQYVGQDFRSLVKIDLDMITGNPDVSRLIEAQMVWDTHFGQYANPTAAVEEITWPTS
jgi:hypothetical protein